MANEALKKSQKDEIKNIAKGIITAQTNEIKQMLAWQMAWEKYIAATGNARLQETK